MELRYTARALALCCASTSIALVDLAVGVLILDGLAVWGRYVGTVFGMELPVGVVEEVVCDAPLLVMREPLRRDTIEAELMVEF